MNTEPVFFVDDDEDDYELLQQIWSDLNYQHPLHHFKSGEEVIHYMKLHNTWPFLIISDINLKGMNGLEFRRKVVEDAELKEKGIPFVFLSTTAPNGRVIQAYDASAHGFFLKDVSYDEMKKTISIIMEYWRRSKSPQ